MTYSPNINGKVSPHEFVEKVAEKDVTFFMNLARGQQSLAPTQEAELTTHVEQFLSTISPEQLEEFFQTIWEANETSMTIQTARETFFIVSNEIIFSKLMSPRVQEDTEASGLSLHTSLKEMVREAKEEQKVFPAEKIHYLAQRKEMQDILGIALAAQEVTFEQQTSRLEQGSILVPLAAQSIEQVESEVTKKPRIPFAIAGQTKLPDFEAKGSQRMQQPPQEKRRYEKHPRDRSVDMEEMEFEGGRQPAVERTERRRGQMQGEKKKGLGRVTPWIAGGIVSGTAILPFLL